ncbi:hypothetical protein ILUMI_15047, partial [Ignelater luminosus]
QLVLKLGHEGHPCMMKMKGILRTKVWWPKMNQAVEKLVQQCHGCQLVSKPDPSEPIYRTPLPKAPWDHICIDYLGPLPTGDHILVVTDYYSHNGKAFVATQFLEFCEEHGIQLNHTTRLWPQANGEVEPPTRNTKESSIQNGDQVLVQQPKLDKFTTVFQSTPYKVVNRKGTQIEVMSPKGVCYKRNTSKLKKYYGNNDDIPVTQTSEKIHHEDVQVEHDPMRRESSMEPKEEGNEPERSFLSTRSPVRLRSHP